MTATVPERLRSFAQIYEERASLYGKNYLHAGEVLLGLFPDGLTLKTAEDFNRFHLIVHLTSKISRYAEMAAKGGHIDSLSDLSVYATMLQEYDALCLEARET